STQEPPTVRSLILITNGYRRCTTARPAFNDFRARRSVVGCNGLWWLSTTDITASPVVGLPSRAAPEGATPALRPVSPLPCCTPVVERARPPSPAPRFEATPAVSADAGSRAWS